MTLEPTVACVIRHIPTRPEMLMEAIGSVVAQTRPVDQLVVATDRDGGGAAAMRERAFAAVDCDWAFTLDDDDWLDPTFVERCLQTAVNCHADVVYTGYTVVGGGDPFPEMFGRPFDPTVLRDHSCIPGACALVRTEVIHAAGFPHLGDADFNLADPRWPGAICEDWAWLLRLLKEGAVFVHLPERLWFYRHHGFGSPGTQGNTSGLATRWM